MMTPQKKTVLNRRFQKRNLVVVAALLACAALPAATVTTEGTVLTIKAVPARIHAHLPLTSGESLNSFWSFSSVIGLRRTLVKPLDSAWLRDSTSAVTR